MAAIDQGDQDSPEALLPTPTAVTVMDGSDTSSPLPACQVIVISAAPDDQALREVMQLIAGAR